MAIHHLVKARALDCAHMPAPEIRDFLEATDWTEVEGIEPEVAAELNDGEGLPSVRTIQAWLAAPENRPDNDTGPAWTLADANGPEAAVILESLAAAIEETEGRVQHFSKCLAGWIVKVGCAAPDLSPWQRYVYANHYRERTKAKLDTSSLDAVLALAPWRDKWARAHRALLAGWLTTPGTLPGPYPGGRHGSAEEWLANRRVAAPSEAGPRTVVLRADDRVVEDSEDTTDGKDGTWGVLSVKGEKGNG